MMRIIMCALLLIGGFVMSQTQGKQGTLVPSIASGMRGNSSGGGSECFMYIGQDGRIISEAEFWATQNKVKVNLLHQELKELKKLFKEQNEILEKILERLSADSTIKLYLSPTKQERE